MTAEASVVPIAALVLAAPEATQAARSAAGAVAEPGAATIGGLAFATCQRVELYGSPRAIAGVRHDAAWESARHLDGEAAVRHAVSTAIGLESAVLAEDQVLHQLRTSVATARARATLAPELDVLFEVALRAGRIARSWRPGSPRSLADLAVDRIALAHGGLVDRRVLVVGAGGIGRLVAVAARRSGARVVVASPTAGHALRLADDVAGEVVPFDPGRAIAGIDGVVIALGGPWRIGDETLQALAGVPLVIDLSMPPAMPDRLVDALGDRSLDLDRLAAGAGVAPGGTTDGDHERYRRRLEQLRERTVERYLERLADRRRSATAVALAERIERERAAELDALWQRLPNLRAEDRDAIERMTRHLAKRLLGEPLARLGSDPSGRRRRAAEELFEL